MGGLGIWGEHLVLNGQGNAFYGMVDILGKIYDTGYEPIKGDGGAIIGVYYVGYMME